MVGNNRQHKLRSHAQRTSSDMASYQHLCCAVTHNYFVALAAFN